MNKLTVAITAWHNEKVITDNVTLLRKLSTTEHPIEIIIYVQECAQQDQAYIEWWQRSAAMVYQSVTNTGQSVSRNWMLKNATGDHILFLDADITLIPGSVEAMLEYLKARPTVLGIHYDVHNDVHAEAYATKFELGIIDADVEDRETLLFHYAMYKTKLIRNFTLPEFFPFNVPGWGVEEDVAYLADRTARTRCIMHRKYMHHREGQSRNFLGQENFIRSRIQRYCAWQALKHMPTRDYRLYIEKAANSTTLPMVPVRSLLLVENNEGDMVTKCAQDMLKYFFPYDFTTPIEVGHLLMWDHDRDVVENDGRDSRYTGFNCLPTRVSPLWLAANLPIYVSNWTREYGHKDVEIPVNRAPSRFDYLCHLSRNNIDSVCTDDPEFHLMNCLLGVPSTMTDSKRHDVLKEYGIQAKMTYPMCDTFRTLIQETSLSRVIAPLTSMIQMHLSSHE